MATDPHTIERYRLAARACCRGLALLSALMAVSSAVSVALDVAAAFTIGPYTGNPGSIYSYYSLRVGFGWLVVALAAWKFDRRFARWLVPAPKPGHCPKCGYSLHGIAGSPICPECGADLRPPPPPASA